jgi:hypothetical protein
MIPEVNENQADFVLGYVGAGGLNKMVRKLDIDDSKENLVADLQPDLIEAFSNKFPEAELTDLDNVVTWILFKSFAKMSK